MHLSVVPSFDGGQVFVEMQNMETGTRIGHATMDVRYHEGGYEPQTVIPGQEVTMMMEFQAIDAIVQAGQGIEAFKVVCDETNNTTADIEQNRLRGTIQVVPTRAVEFISVDFIITNSGVTFE